MFFLSCFVFSEASNLSVNGSVTDDVSTDYKTLYDTLWPDAFISICPAKKKDANAAVMYLLELIKVYRLIDDFAHRFMKHTTCQG